MVYPPEDGYPSRYKPARRALTTFIRRTPLTTTPRRQPKDGTRAPDNYVLACNFAKYLPDLKFFFTHRLSNKLFLIWLLTTPPHLKYAATLPCNSSLRACFADINVLQGSGEW